MKAGRKKPEVAPLPRSQTYRIERSDIGSVRYRGLHRGKGSVGVQLLFARGSSARSALLYLYNIPPGASEGIHKHAPGDRRAGSYDEIYFVLAGHGVMQIADERVAVRRGDHIFVANGVAHGIENNSRRPLKLHLVALKRG